MPIPTKGQKILTTLHNEYGVKKGTQIFYAGINSGKFTGVEGKTKKKPIPKKKK